MSEMEWNWIAVQFDREMQRKEDARGKQLIPLFLDHLLQDSCSDDVKDAFKEALRKFFIKSNQSKDN